MNKVAEVPEDSILAERGEGGRKGEGLHLFGQ